MKRREKYRRKRADGSKFTTPSYGARRQLRRRHNAAAKVARKANR